MGNNWYENNPTQIAIKEVMTYITTIFTAIRPRAFISPKSAILAAMEKNTRGATISFNAFMKMVYTGIKRFVLIPFETSAGRAVCIMSPVAIPSTRAISV